MQGQDEEAGGSGATVAGGQGRSGQWPLDIQGWSSGCRNGNHIYFDRFMNTGVSLTKSAGRQLNPRLSI